MYQEEALAQVCLDCQDAAECAGRGSLPLSVFVGFGGGVSVVAGSDWLCRCSCFGNGWRSVLRVDSCREAAENISG